MVSTEKNMKINTKGRSSSHLFSCLLKRLLIEESRRCNIVEIENINSQSFQFWRGK